MKVHKTIFGWIAVGMLLLTQGIAHGNGWMWMESYPWAWSEEKGSWLYLVPKANTGFAAYNVESESWETVGTVFEIPDARRLGIVELNPNHAYTDSVRRVEFL